MMNTKIAQPSDFPAIAEIIAQQNASPHLCCLHSHDGAAENVLKTMHNWLDEASIRFAIGVDDAGQIIGVFGCEYDVEVARGWLWGPFVPHGDNTPEQWTQIVAALYPTLAEALPFQPSRLDALINQPFQLGRDFYEQRGYVYAQSAYVYIAPRPATPLVITEQAVPLTYYHAASFSALFDEVFPKTFITGAAVAERVLGNVADELSEQVFVVTANNRAKGADASTVLGFNYAKVNDSASEGYIEFIGVSARARRQGIGRRVLLSGMAWLFNEKGMPQIGLTTDEDNVGAQHLYAQAGFRLDHTGLNYRKEFAEKREA